MNIAQYQAFIYAAELGNLTKTAEKLGYTQSGITHMLNALENQWGVKLLNRSRSGVSLTADGELLFPIIEGIVNRQHLLDEKIKELKNMQTGLIRIGTFTSVSSHWLPGIFRCFQDRFPDVRFELFHGTNDENEEWVRCGKVDLAFVKIPATEDLETEFLTDDPIVAVVSNESPLAARSELPLDMLCDLPYIELSEGVEAEISEIIAEHKIKTDTRFIERDDYAVIAMVEQDLGVSLIPQLLLTGSNRAVTALPLSPSKYRSLGIAYKDRSHLSKAAACFIETATAWVQSKNQNLPQD